MKPVVFCDIDSTLADTSHRHHLIEGWRDRPKEETDWDAYSLACADDAVMEGPAQLVRELFPTHLIVMMSNRSELAWEATRSWLARNLIPYNALVMGEAGATPSDGAKLRRMQQWLAEHGYTRPALVIDDWPGIAEELKPLGWPTVIVNPLYPPKPEKPFYKVTVHEHEELPVGTSVGSLLPPTPPSVPHEERAFSLGVPTLIGVMLIIFGALITWWAVAAG